MAKTNRERLEAAKVLTPGKKMSKKAAEAIENLTPQQVETLIAKRRQQLDELKGEIENIAGFTPINVHHLV